MGSETFLEVPALEERKVGQLCEVMVNSQAGTDMPGLRKGEGSARAPAATLPGYANVTKESTSVSSHRAH